MLHSGRFQPYSRTDSAGKACRRQTLLLITNYVNYWNKKFYYVGPGLKRLAGYKRYSLIAPSLVTKKTILTKSTPVERSLSGAVTMLPSYKPENSQYKDIN
jgi:hypothetical protein